MQNTITVTTPNHTFESLRFCVDGREWDHPDADMIGDGAYGPFRVFNIEAQDYEPGEYDTREAAQAIADKLNSEAA